MSKIRVKYNGKIKLTCSHQREVGVAAEPRRVALLLRLKHQLPRLIRREHARAPARDFAREQIVRGERVKDVRESESNCEQDSREM